MTYKVVIENVAAINKSLECVENAFDSNPDFGEVEKLTTLRFMLIKGNFMLIPKLESIEIDPESMVASDVQKHRVEMQRLQKLKGDFSTIFERSVDQANIALARALFQSLKKNGLSMGNPAEHTKESERLAKQTGTIPSSLDKDWGDGFITTAWMYRKQPTFVVDGFGAMGTYVSFPKVTEDMLYDRVGHQAPLDPETCVISISVKRTKRDYNCLNFLRQPTATEFLEPVLQDVLEAIKAG